MEPDPTSWIRTAADKRAVAEGCYFDLAAAERVRSFFQRFLRHSKGQFAKQPFTLLDWQWQQVIAPLFGWKRADGTRRFRRGYIEIPKKNGKSTLFSGLSLFMLVGDKEPGAEVYSAAVDRDQASIVYHEAANMVEASPHLSSRLDVVRSTRRIIDQRTRSVYKALSADVPAKEGLNAHAVLIDFSADIWGPCVFLLTCHNERHRCKKAAVAKPAAREKCGEVPMEFFRTIVRLGHPISTSWLA